MYPEKTFPTLKMVFFKKKRKKKRFYQGDTLKIFENLDNCEINILAKILAKSPSPPILLNVVFVLKRVLFSATRSITKLSEGKNGVKNIVN